MLEKKITFVNLPLAKNLRYKGFHPIDKKATIKKAEETLKNFHDKILEIKTSYVKNNLEKYYKKDYFPKGEEGRKLQQSIDAQINYAIVNKCDEVKNICGKYVGAITNAKQTLKEKIEILDDINDDVTSLKQTGVLLGVIERYMKWLPHILKTFDEFKKFVDEFRRELQKDPIIKLVETTYDMPDLFINYFLARHYYDKDYITYFYSILSDELKKFEDDSARSTRETFGLYAQRETKRTEFLIHLKYMLDPLENPLKPTSGNIISWNPTVARRLILDTVYVKDKFEVLNSSLERKQWMNVRSVVHVIENNLKRAAEENKSVYNTKRTNVLNVHLLPEVLVGINEWISLVLHTKSSDKSDKQADLDKLEQLEDALKACQKGLISKAAINEKHLNVMDACFGALSGWEKEEGNVAFKNIKDINTNSTLSALFNMVEYNTATEIKNCIKKYLNLPEKSNKHKIQRKCISFEDIMKITSNDLSCSGSIESKNKIIADIKSMCNDLKKSFSNIYIKVADKCKIFDNYFNEKLSIHRGYLVKLSTAPSIYGNFTFTNLFTARYDGLKNKLLKKVNIWMDDSANSPEEISKQISSFKEYIKKEKEKIETLVDDLVSDIKDSLDDKITRKLKQKQKSKCDKYLKKYIPFFEKILENKKNENGETAQIKNFENTLGELKNTLNTGNSLPDHSIMLLDRFVNLLGSDKSAVPKNKYKEYMQTLSKEEREKYKTFPNINEETDRVLIELYSLITDDGSRSDGSLQRRVENFILLKNE